MYTSGAAAITTNGSDNAVDLITAADNKYGIRERLVIINEDKVPGFFSIDGGTTWARFPDGAEVVDLCPVRVTEKTAVQFKRVAGGTDATKLFAWGY